jgi:hypothetical protein
MSDRTLVRGIDAQRLTLFDKDGVNVRDREVRESHHAIS